MDEIISGEIDIYQKLGLASDATQLQISKAYRRQALQLHPDKNSSPEANSEFQLLNVIYSILSDPDIRTRYDRLRAKVSEVSDGSTWEDRAQEFRVKLQKAESDKRTRAAKEQLLNAGNATNLAKLEMAGLRLRYEYQLLRPASKDYVSFKDLHQNQIIQRLSPSKQVEVQWKQKEDEDAIIDDKILGAIMSIFGVVVLSHTTHVLARYAVGIVEFERAEDAQRAASHNFKESARLWDGSKYRKRASLLRACKVVHVNPSIMSIVDLR
ncbi:CIC11C00000003342 [Sungouiella intermedia]|uniref:CIC11C00000003342 n=1 Tax=Sungouiella intermedia TaxID=45354 RepID=A0A1L0BM93_9ASCO|nr:CIC11C00000003342 [[Candida] intermedia]